VPSGSPATLTAGMGANESLESLGALRGILAGGQASQKTPAPHLGYGLKRSTLWTGGLRSTQYPKIYPPIYLPFSYASLVFPRLL
jgi:hypothetical protein